MNRIIVILISLLLFSCKNDDYKDIELYFWSFRQLPVKFIINIKDNSLELLKYDYVISGYDTIYASTMEYFINDSTLAKSVTDSNDFELMPNYVLKKTPLVKKKYNITVDLNAFLSELKDCHLPSYLEHISDIHDGHGFSLTAITNSNDSIRFRSKVPARITDYELDYKILDSFFKLVESVVDDYESICIIESIKDRYDYGLPIKLISENPLEYRIWGTISGCKEDQPELIEFIKKLPDNEPIIFDVRNGGFSYCIYEVFEELSKRKQISFYGVDMKKFDWPLNMEIENVYRTKEQLK